MSKKIYAVIFATTALALGTLAVSTTATPVNADTTEQISQNNEKSIFTKDETNKINANVNEFLQLEKNTKSIDDLYSTQPQLDVNSAFNKGQTNSGAIQNNIDWLNYYRKIAGLSPVHSTDELIQKSQLVAAVEGAAKTMTHNLTSDATKPSNVSDADWQQASENAKKSVLISAGGYSRMLQESNENWLLDNHNVVNGEGSVGHRQALLSPSINAIGFGSAKGSSAAVIDDKALPKFNKESPFIVNYPASGLFPVNMIAPQGTPWSVDFGSNSGFSLPENGDVKVNVQNLTTGQSLDLNKDQINITSGYSRIGSSISFQVDQNKIAINANNAYRVTVKTQSNPYEYEFKLYDNKTLLSLDTADEGSNIVFDNGSSVHFQDTGYLYDRKANGYRWFENGELFTGFRFYTGTYYWFENGVRSDNAWHEAWGLKYYTDQDGRAVQGTRIIDGTLHYFGDDNTYYERPITGYVYDGSPANGGWRWYENGELYTGFRYHAGTYYWFINGVRQNAGWRQAWGLTYYTDNDGRAVQGHQTIDGKEYDFGNNNTYYLR